MRLDVEHRGLQAGGFGQALPVLHAVLARGGDQHLDVAGRGRARADDAEVEADFVERERDVLVGLGLDLQLELLVAQAAGSMIFLVMTADCGIAITTCGCGCRSLAIRRLTASATSSNFSIWPSVIQPFSKPSEPNRSSTYSPRRSWPSSTSFTLDELMSSPIIGGCVTAEQRVKQAHDAFLPRRMKGELDC